MAVRLELAGAGLEVGLSGADAIAAFSRGLFLPFERIVGTRVVTRDDAIASSPRLPCPGLRWTHRLRSGSGGVGEPRQLWCVHGRTVVLVI